MHLKDGHELDAYLLRVALKDAKLDPGLPGATVLQGEALETLARQYVLANNVVERLSNWMDVEALRAMANGSGAEPRHAGSRRSRGDSARRGSSTPPRWWPSSTRAATSTTCASAACTTAT